MVILVVEPSIVLDKLPQVSLIDQVFYLLLQVITIFGFMSDVSIVRAVEVSIPLLFLPGHLRWGTPKVILFHHSEDM